MNRYLHVNQRVFKVIISFVMAIAALLLLPGMSVCAEDTILTEIIIPDDYGTVVAGEPCGAVRGYDIRLTNVSYLGNDLYVITEKVGRPGTAAGDFTGQILKAYPDKTATEYFSHKIYYHDGQLMAILITKVTGLYSQVDGGSAQMLSISGSVSGDYASDFSYRTSISGDTGTLYLYYSGISSGTFKYRIYSNGYIKNI